MILDWNIDSRSRKTYIAKIIDDVMSCLRSVCDLEEGLVFGDIIKFVRSFPPLVDFLSFYSWCNAIKEFNAQIDELSPNNIDENLVIEKIEIYWQVEIHEDDFILDPNLHGVGKHYREDDYGNNKWRETEVSLSLTHLADIKNLPIVLNKKVNLEEWREFQKTKEIPIIDEFEKQFSLLNILDAIYWDISFYGGPLKRKEVAEDLKKSVEMVRSGKAKLIPAEEAFEKIMGKREKNDSQIK